MRKSVVYSASRNLYPFLPNAINSLKEHTEVDRIYLLAEDPVVPNIPEDVRVINTTGQKYFSSWGPNYSSSFTHMALIRGAYCDLLKDEDLVLQLDIDTIIVDDISALWSVDYTNYYISCTQEYNGNYKPFGDKYYNIGVCMFNLKKMREDGIDQKLIKMLNGMKLTYVEQDALNFLCEGHILPMGSIYNATMFTGMPGDRKIRHFAGVPYWWEDDEYIRLTSPQNFDGWS